MNPVFSLDRNLDSPLMAPLNRMQVCLALNGFGLSLYNTACVVAPRFITGAEVNP